ncbi:MAG: 4-hydroxybenzoate octaprenyltransferase [Bdellovibrionales bacterium]
MSLHTDIKSGDWIDRLLPRGVRPYARLMRLDRPIGTWLLFLPCCWSVALASPHGMSLYYLFLFGVGSLLMRGAGCAINDMWDVELDRRVERTQKRPLAAGEVSLRQALVFVAVLCVLSLLILLQFNALTIGIGLASMALVVSYPLAKRVTWWPQFVLGMTFNWGALLGWSAVRETIELPALLLYVAGVFWTLAYDTIYAHQDKADDARIGVKSLALYLGERSKLWIAGFFDLCFLCLIAAGWLSGLSSWFYVGIGMGYAHAIWQLLTWLEDNPQSSLDKFKSNRDFGLIIMAAILMGKLF